MNITQHLPQRLVLLETLSCTLSTDLFRYGIPILDKCLLLLSTFVDVKRCCTTGQRCFQCFLLGFVPDVFLRFLAGGFLVGGVGPLATVAFILVHGYVRLAFGAGFTLQKRGEDRRVRCESDGWRIWRNPFI